MDLGFNAAKGQIVTENETFRDPHANDGNTTGVAVGAVRSRTHLSVPEYAQATGLSASTVWRRVKDGSLAVLQLGGKGCRVAIPVAAIQQNAANGAPGAEAEPGSDLSERADHAVGGAATLPLATQKSSGIPGPSPRWKQQ
jgi:hypothetical protein